MSRFAAVAFVVVLAIALPGCGNSPDSLITKQIDLMNEMADAYEKNAPQTKIDEIKARADENNKKLVALKLSDDEKKKLFDKHKDALEKAIERLMKASAGKAMKDLGSFGK